MRCTLAIIALTALLCCGAWAQAAADSPVFEAASVKPSPAPEPGQVVFGKMNGGPGSKDPTRIDYQRLSIDILVARAYGMNQWQLFGPDWTKRGQFDIVAKLPPGTTKEQFQAMLRNLLAERFKVQVHRETKELTGYSLTVGKSGPKLKPHVDAPALADEDKSRRTGFTLPKTGADGYPILTKEVNMASMDGKSRKRWDNADIGELAETLSSYLRSPVTDDTGLHGKYDIDLYWLSQTSGAQSDSDTGPDLFAAVHQQLGLKLEKKKMPVETLVIDHAERVPTGN